MNKNRFIKELQRAIAKLPADEQTEILQDYEEYFVMGALDGKSEEEIAKSLGSPKTIGKEFTANYRIDIVEKKPTMGNFLRATWLVIGLGFFNLLIVLGPFLVLASVVLAFWLSGIGFMSAPIIVLLNNMIYPETFVFFDLFNAIAICGLGLFISVGSFLLTKVFVDLFVRYLKYNTKIVKGGIRDV